MQGITKGSEEKGKSWKAGRNRKAHRFLRLAGTLDATPEASFAEEERSGATSASAIFTWNIKTKRHLQGTTKGAEEKRKLWESKKERKAHRFLRLAGTLGATPEASFAEEE